ncbi:MAG: glycosyltransferase 87 family protein [Solirubrobacteraceae bacterium]|jgi:hypothetical protein
MSFIALLAAAPLLPSLGNSVWTYPAVSHSWVLFVFCGLFLLGLIDFSHLRRIFHLDLLVLLSFAIALSCWSQSRWLACLFIYPPLVYLGVRMAIAARLLRRDPAKPSRDRGEGEGRALAPTLGASWLIVGIVVLAGVHAGWTLDSRVNTDVGYGGVQGAMKILHGEPLYGADRALVAHLGYDPHLDTYGPLNYEAYIPFASVATATTAARLTALFFDLLTALLLFALGRRVRSPSTGVRLAYAWLAFPFTLYAAGLGSNDSMVAAALVATLLLASSPVRRGAMLALAAWSKLSPLALVPVMAAHDPSGAHRRRALLGFAAAFTLASGLIFVPALAHSGASTFLTRTFGFQFERNPGYSIWARVDYGAFAAWIKTAAGVLHGLLIALSGGFAAALLWKPKRQDAVGLAAASAAVLIAVQVCDGYYSFTYILWFLPLVLIALVLDRGEPRVRSAPAQAMTVSSLGRELRISLPLAPTTSRSSILTPSRPGR